LREIYEVVPMSQIPDLAPRIVKGEVRGRIVVDVNA
jgi:D-arabinose 1-dehydrogenase-like Zn-dependent alcohol dehydrogenase